MNRDNNDNTGINDISNINNVSDINNVYDEEYIIYQTAEETVFAIPELRRYILSYAIDDENDDNIQVNDNLHKRSCIEESKLNCVGCCCLPVFLYHLIKFGLICNSC